MELKVLGREINIFLQVPRDENFASIFIQLGEAFRVEEFKNIYLNQEEEQTGKPAFFPSDFIDRKNTNHFHITIMENDEKRFYEFLQKFCEERNISFDNPNKSKHYLRERAIARSTKVFQEYKNKKF